MRRSHLVLGVGVVVAAVMWWMHGDRDEAADDPIADHGSAEGDTSGRSGSGSKTLVKGRNGKLSGATHAEGAVTIGGHVIDDTKTGVDGVEVVFRGEGGEETVMSGAEGKYQIELQPGTYRAFVRDDHVLSVGQAGRQRLPSHPDADAIGMPDEGAMSLVVASHDADNIDLRVIRAGAITGHVHDRSGNPVAHAVVRALGRTKPVLGTDVVETDTQGAFKMLVPAGAWRLDATHPRYAGLGRSPAIYVDGNETADIDLELIAGCVITGRVIAANGTPAGDGAIEKRWGTTDTEFAPAGKIAADGTFRWVTTETTDVTLRAWPWKSPPSQMQSFSCTDGARFSAVFQVPARGADIDGTLADATGAPVALAYVDLAPLDPGGIAQQERSDADGKWAVFQMPPGRYRVSAYAQGRGVVSTIVTSPQTGVRLALGGTGRFEGTTKQIVDGSFSLQLASCTFDGRPMAIPDDHLIVSVVGGRFSIDDLPACSLKAFASSDGSPIALQIDIPAGGTATKELSFEPEPPPPAPEEHVVPDQPDRPADDIIKEPDLPDELETPRTDDENQQQGVIDYSDAKYVIY